MAEPVPAPTSADPAASDRAAGFEITPEFERFAQRNDIYRRSFWDPAIRSPKTERFYRTYREPLAEWRRADGFTQRDYALRNAAWHVSDLFTEARRDQDRREQIEQDGDDHRYGASSSSRRASSGSQRSPFASSLSLLYSNSSRVSVANSKFGPSTIASTGQASSHSPQ